jgi:hypothetical protein
MALSDRPAGSNELPNDNCDLDWTSRNCDADDERIPNSNVIGRSSSDQNDAVKVKSVCSSEPLIGDKVKLPGRGGPLVVINIEARDTKFEFANLQVRVTVRLDLGGSEFAPRTK